NDCKTKTRTKTVNKRTTTETYQDCSRVNVGTHQESYRKLVKPGKSAMYCVELDRVKSGDKLRDDGTSEVSRSTDPTRATQHEGGREGQEPELLARGHDLQALTPWN